MAPGSWRNYYRDEIDDANDDTSDSKSKIIYKTKIVWNTPITPPQHGNPGDANQLTQPATPTLNVEEPIPLKYLSNVRRFPFYPL